MTEHRCENCIWWEDGYCDRTGYVKCEDDTCDKWSDQYDDDD